jgi:tetratricopeptide (TPR) repeat protein
MMSAAQPGSGAVDGRTPEQPGQPFVGRARELGELDARLAGLPATAAGGAILVTGEAGIGKTRLVEVAAQRAAALGVLPLWATAWDGGGAPAYWPWVQVIRALAATRDDEQLQAEVGPGGSWLARLVPELAERLPQAAPEPPEDPVQARFALFDALATFLERASKATPLMVVLDDASRADPGSLLALEFVVGRLRDTPVLVLATVREPDPASSDSTEILTTIARGGLRIPLGGLAVAELAALIERRSGGSAAAGLSEAIHSATGGNPFFSDEVVRLLVAEQRVSQVVDVRRLPLPAGVLEAVRQRLEPLPAEVLGTLSVAAVIGEQFTLATLQRALAAGAETALEALDVAEAAGLVHEVPGEVGRFRFSHGLLREALYQRLSASRRVRGHHAVGLALEERYGAAVEPHVAELAHHFVEAAPTGEVERAVDYASRAGRRALRAVAYEEAARWFDAALRAHELGERNERRSAELLLARGASELKADDPAAHETLLNAAAEARVLGAADLEAEAALTLAGFGLSPGIIDADLVRLLNDALDAVGPDDSAPRARLLARLSEALYWSQSTDHRLELVEEAIAIARRLDDPPTLAFVLSHGFVATWSAAGAARGLAWADELLALAERVGDVELGLQARSWRIDVLFELGDLAASDRAIAEFDSLAEHLRQPRAMWYRPLVKAMRATMRGRFDEAAELHRAGADMASSFPRSMAPQIAAAQLFFMAWYRGGLEELEPAVRDFADRYPSLPVWRCALAACHRQRGDHAAMQRELDRVADRDFAVLPDDNVRLVACALLSEVVADLGDAPRAQALYDLMLPMADHNVVSPQAGLLGPVARYLGLCAATTGDIDQARKHFAAAREGARRADAAPLLALLALDEGSLLLRTGDVARGRELAAEAADRARRLNLEWVVARADRVLEEVGALPSRPTTGASGETVAASLRNEGEVWAIGFDDRVVRIRDAKGLHYLGRLLAHPGVEFHALDLVGGETAVPTTAAVGASREDDLHVGTGGDAGPALDSAAKSAYKARIAELRAELDEAESFNDPERADRAREELEFVGRELAGAVGLGGRDRKLKSDAERARVNVTRAIRSVIKRVADEDAALGHELDATVRTGTFCVHEPDPRAPVRWEVGT